MLKPEIEYSTPKVESILFVGGSPEKLPRIKSSIKINHWTVDNKDRPLPSPLPDLIVVIEDKVNLGMMTKAYEIADANKIKTIKSYYYDDNIVLAGANLKMDVRSIFENEKSLQFPIFGPRKIMEILERTKDDNRKRHRKIIGDLAEYIIDLAKKEKYSYPLKPQELVYLADMVRSEKNETVTIKQVKRLLKVNHDIEESRSENSIEPDEPLMESQQKNQEGQSYQTPENAISDPSPQPVEAVEVTENNEENASEAEEIGGLEGGYGFENDYAGESDEEKKHRLYTRDRLHNVLVERIGVLQTRNEKLITKIKNLKKKLAQIRSIVDEQV